MSYVKKQNTKKELQKLLDSNAQVVEFLEYIKGRYDFSEDEKKRIDDSMQYVKDMTFIFSQMKSVL
ncbi:hypothetical protein MF621_003953 (plasmid) [Bacillus velezensis]|uniref:Uncharacterized protein n=1 Tax=Bacillus siamensis TaxID=659243 RepID=A0AAI8HSM3_9BACI|nr:MULTISPECIES: hypothetical protein [Bacillus amyloliquefaciens group]KDN91180.1 hypothetical protein EF87_20290 [Bacillus amyloliquefaciens]AUJ79458.1 hypothetical protein CWD84_22010 [Bacillus siamensis]QVL41470.1 hypothetical protein KH263_19755 [Bacillus velezensis]URJ72536.1 hypothetical protein MF619_000026 [Bacillus velezensis]URJ72554.1 hypothetical protein MF619_000009 [Bacillus velezensis]